MIRLLAERVEHDRQNLSNGWIWAIVAAGVAVAIRGRGVTHAMDRSRIAKYAAEQGWEMIACQWKLLGPGWFGNSRERIYAIQYRDREGRVHSAFAKTSALAGVYLTQDQVEG
jgi:hypothetical protein